jgi:MFS family permease
MTQTIKSTNLEKYHIGLKGNIWKIYAFSFLRWLSFIIPVLVLFFKKEINMSQSQIIILQVFFTVLVLLTEIPSGYFADKFSRRTSLIVAAICVSIATIGYTLSQTFWQLLIFEIFYALSNVFKSGSDTAILYDSLAELNETDDFHKIQGRMQSSWSLAEGISAIFGGIIAAYLGLRAPLYFQIPVILMLIPLAFSLVEPKRHTFEDPDSNWQNIVKAIKFTLVKKATLRWIILCEAFIGVGEYFIIWFIQPYWESLHIKIIYFGLLWALLQFNIAFWAFISHKLNKINPIKIFFTAILFETLAYLYLGLYTNYLGVLVIFIFGTFRGLLKPFLSTILNHEAPSEMRATINSVQSMTSSLCFSIIAPFLGYSADLYSSQTAFLIAGTLIGSLSLISLSLYALSISKSSTHK